MLDIFQHGLVGAGPIVYDQQRVPAKITERFNSTRRPEATIHKNRTVVRTVSKAIDLRNIAIKVVRSICDALFLDFPGVPTRRNQNAASYHNGNRLDKPIDTAQKMRRVACAPVKVPPAAIKRLAHLSPEAMLLFDHSRNLSHTNDISNLVHIQIKLP